MKRRKFIFLVAIACLMLSIATSCVNKSSTQNPQSVGDTLTLNLQRDSFTYVPSIPNSCRYGEFWTGTYGNNGGFNSGEFHFSHNSGVDTFSYWGGFTPSKDADARCFTIKCYTGDSCQCQSANLPCGQDSLDGSWGWIHNQWGCMAGHGLDSIYQESQTAPYLVAYWDYYSDTQGQNSLEVTLADGSLFQPVEVYICNHPWPYWGNICGDGFAHPFEEGDEFLLWIHAVKWDNREDSIPVELAFYNDGVIQETTWQKFPLVGFWDDSYNSPDSIKSLYFTMYSTDDSEWGPNTAVYFCMDKLKVVDQGPAPIPAAQDAKASKAGRQAIELRDHIALTSHKGGFVSVYDNKNKEVLRVTVKAGKDRIDLSKLPAGEYRVRHGHKSIPIKKIK